MVCKGRLAGKQRHACSHSLPPSSWDCVLHFGLSFLLTGIVVIYFFLVIMCTMYQPQERVYICQRELLPVIAVNFTLKMLFSTFLLVNMYLPLRYLISLLHIMIKNIPYQNPDLRNIRNLCFAILFP